MILDIHSTTRVSWPGRGSQLQNYEDSRGLLSYSVGVWAKLLMLIVLIQPLGQGEPFRVLSALHIGSERFLR
jgi:hypothetical protein